MKKKKKIASDCQLWIRIFNTLQYAAVHCNTLQHTATRTDSCHTALDPRLQRLCYAHEKKKRYARQIVTQLWIRVFNTLQHTAAHCNTLQHTLQHLQTHEILSHSSGSASSTPLFRACPPPLHICTPTHRPRVLTSSCGYLRFHRLRRNGLCVPVCTCVCLCVCVHVCMRVCVCVCVCVCGYLRFRRLQRNGLCVSVCTCVCAYVCACVCVRVHVCMRVCMCVCLCGYLRFRRLRRNGSYSPPSLLQCVAVTCCSC